MVESPDFIKQHYPNFCNCCGESLEHSALIADGKRQVFDIPKIEIKVTEHQLYKKQCSCGHVNEVEYPTQANAPVSYGNNIESLIGYFHTRQYLPFKRMQEMFNDVFNAPISEGGLHYILDKLVCKAKPAYELIKQRMQANTKLAVGSDETGMKVNSDKHWAWTWQNEESTFITITDNRAQISITDTFKDGFKNAVLVHEVPPDNNASERAIRDIKIKQKISGQFNSTNGAFRFAVLRSITDTILKNKLNILEPLGFIANLETD